ncbi:MAG: LysM peptidoglycan-binding domain-containing protein, partial [Bacteroidota bacterium]|nr:LysM peptidoglycan-binding domain-containing protein [Bacteroidota bacterium]
MRLTVIRLIAFLFVFLFCTYNGIAQVVVEKSSITEVIEGKRYYMHTIEQGQTLYSISRVYDLSIDEIYFENPDARSGLQTGDILRIPFLSRDKEISNELRSSSFNYIFHIVQQGETLYSISKIYDVSLDDLKHANPGADQSLKIGQYLKVPVRSQEILQDEGDLPAEEPASQLIKHVVAAEETLFSISKNYNLSVDDLKQYNPGLTNQIS